MNRRRRDGTMRILVMLVGIGTLVSAPCRQSAGQNESIMEEIRGLDPAFPGEGSPAVRARSANAGQEIQDVMEFINRDKLHGRLIAIYPDLNGARWKHPNSREDINFAVEGLSQIALAGSAPSRMDDGTSVRLTNDDLLVGKLVSMDAETLTLETPYSGTVRIKRPMIAAVNPGSESSSVIYRGPASMAEWTVSRSNVANAWRYKEGALYGNAQVSIGRYMPGMPDDADIEFKLAWSDAYPSFYISFFTDNIQGYNGNCYSLRMTGNSIYLYRYTSHSGSRSIGSINVDDFSENRIRSSTFNLLVSKKANAVTLLMDGKVLKQWSDSGQFAGNGNGLVFMPQTQGGVRISDISVRKWDGKLPAAGGAAGGADQDMIRFVNGDKVSGLLQTIADNTVKFKTSYATLTVPVERIDTIQMSSANAQRARRNKGDIRAVFHGMGTVTMELGKAEHGQIEGKSENFGRMAIPLPVLRVIEFNIYRDKTAENSDEFDF